MISDIIHDRKKYILNFNELKNIKINPYSDCGPKIVTSKGFTNVRYTALFLIETLI